MRGFRALVPAAVGGIAMTAAAHAADPAGTWSPLEFKKPYTTELISGWYVRGDFGFSKPTIAAVEVPPPQVVTSWNLQSSPTLGFGTGYKYKWFRSDVTLDYANRGRFQGDTAAVPGYYTAKLDSFTLLANVYLDLGDWGGFTPYIGAGVGTSHLRTHEYTNVTIQEPGFGVNDATRWNLSWAAMGGIAFRFSPSLLLDVGYRYLKMGDAVSGTEPPAYTTRTYFRDITAQEVRVGLRWVLD
jgi:opacity protein-like surface antigen